MDLENEDILDGNIDKLDRETPRCNLSEEEEEQHHQRNRNKHKTSEQGGPPGKWLPDKKTTSALQTPASMSYSGHSVPNPTSPYTKRAYRGPPSTSSADNKSDPLSPRVISSGGTTVPSSSTSAIGQPSQMANNQLSKSVSHGESLIAQHGGPSTPLRGGPPMSQSGTSTMTTNGPVMAQHGGPLMTQHGGTLVSSQDVTAAQSNTHKVRIMSPKSPRAMAAHMLTPQATPDRATHDRATHDRAANTTDPVDSAHKILQMHPSKTYPHRQCPMSTQIQSPLKTKTLPPISKKPLSSPSHTVPPKSVKVSPMNYHQGPPNPQYQKMQRNAGIKKSQTQNIPEAKRLEANVIPDVKQLEANPLQKAQRMRQVEDEILLKSRELDMCWHEDEIDCVRDFTDVDRRKEMTYAETSEEGIYQRASDQIIKRPPIWHDDEIDSVKDFSDKKGGAREESSKAGSEENVCLSPPWNEEEEEEAMTLTEGLVMVPREYKESAVSSSIAVSSSAVVISKADSKTHHVTFSQYPYMEDETDSVKDYASTALCQLEIGSRVPSSERISLTPPWTPSGCQTPAEGLPHEVKTSSQNINNNNSNTTKNTAATTTTSLTTATTTTTILSESSNDNRVTIAKDDKLDTNEAWKETQFPDVKFRKRNNNSKRLPVAPYVVPRFDDMEEDSVTDYSTTNREQQELSSRIPSYEYLPFTPPWMSENNSGIQTPCGHLPVVSPLIAGDKSTVATTTSSSIVPSVARGYLESNSNESSNMIDSQGKQPPVLDQFRKMNIHSDPQMQAAHMGEDSIKDYSLSLQEQTSRIPSSERICFTPPWMENEEEGEVDGKKQELTLEEQRAIEEEVRKSGIEKEEEKANEMRKANAEGNPETDNNSAHAQGQPGTDSGFCSEQDHNKQQQQQQQFTENDKEHCAPTSGNASELPNIDLQPSLAPSDNSACKESSSVCKESWSSKESSGSNQTDISTVVVAPTSVPITAPGSPDPDGSEVSDSVNSEYENEANSFQQQQQPTGNTEQQQQQQCYPNTSGPDSSRIQIQPQNVYKTQQQQQPHQMPRHGNSNPPHHVCNQYHCQHPHDVSQSKQITSHESGIPRDVNQTGIRQQLVSRDVSQQVITGDKGQQRIAQQSYGGRYQNYPPHILQQMQYRPHMYPASHQLQQQPHIRLNQQQQHPNRSNQQQHIRSVRMLSHGGHGGPPFQPSYPVQFVRNQCPPGGEQARPRPLHTGANQCPPGGDQARSRPLHTGAKQEVHPAEYLSGYTHGQLEMQGKENLDQNKGMPSSEPIGSVSQLDLTQSQDCQGNYQTIAANYQISSSAKTDQIDNASVVSFSSMAASHQNLDQKTDMMSSLLSMLGTHDRDDMARTLLAMSSSPDSCSAMRQSGCLPLLINLLHDPAYETKGINWEARHRAGLALHNVIHSGNTDRRGRREVRVLRLLEIVRAHSESVLSGKMEKYRSHRGAPPLREHGPGPAVAALMKLSFEEEHKNTICELGGLQSMAELFMVDHKINGHCHDPYSVTLRKYAGMALINLTYSDIKNKSILVSMTGAIIAIVTLLRFTEEEDLIQVLAGILRNVSWRADDASKKQLADFETVKALMTSSQRARSEASIRTVLSAVWNLSAHSSSNKEEICSTPGSLKFLCFAINYRSPSRSLAVIENAGGILRNVSSHIAVRPEYRQILREQGCLQVLISHLRSPSTRVVSNSCGILWNLSARCLEDQEILWELGAVSMLKTLVNSKHKSISASSAAALRNLMAVKPGSSSTDNESHVSLHIRTNSFGRQLPANNPRNERRYKSVGAGRKSVGTDRKFQVKDDLSANSSEATQVAKLKSVAPRRQPEEIRKVHRKVKQDTEPHYYANLYQDPPRRGVALPQHRDPTVFLYPPGYTTHTPSAPPSASEDGGKSQPSEENKGQLPGVPVPEGLSKFKSQTVPCSREMQRGIGSQSIHPCTCNHGQGYSDSSPPGPRRYDVQVPPEYPGYNAQPPSALPGYEIKSLHADIDASVMSRQRRHSSSSESSMSPPPLNRHVQKNDASVSVVFREKIYNGSSLRGHRRSMSDTFSELNFNDTNQGVPHAVTDSEIGRQQMANFNIATYQKEHLRHMARGSDLKGHKPPGLEVKGQMSHSQHRMDFYVENAMELRHIIGVQNDQKFPYGQRKNDDHCAQNADGSRGGPNVVSNLVDRTWTERGGPKVVSTSFCENMAVVMGGDKKGALTVHGERPVTDCTVNINTYDDCILSLAKDSLKELLEVSRCRKLSTQSDIPPEYSPPKLFLKEQYYDIRQAHHRRSNETIASSIRSSSEDVAKACDHMHPGTSVWQCDCYESENVWIRRSGRKKKSKAKETNDYNQQDAECSKGFRQYSSRRPEKYSSNQSLPEGCSNLSKSYSKLQHGHHSHIANHVVSDTECRYRYETLYSATGEPRRIAVATGDPARMIMNPGEPGKIVVNTGEPGRIVMNTADPGRMMVNTGDPGRMMVNTCEPGRILNAPCDRMDGDIRRTAMGEPGRINTTTGQSIRTHQLTQFTSCSEVTLPEATHTNYEHHNATGVEDENTQQSSPQQNGSKKPLRSSLKTGESLRKLRHKKVTKKIVSAFDKSKDKNKDDVMQTSL